jgi:hypothetical protein
VYGLQSENLRTLEKQNQDISMKLEKAVEEGGIVATT